jgi:hypothetical protein
MTLQVAGNKRQPWELHSVSFGLPQGQQDTFPGPQSFPEAGAFFIQRKSLATGRALDKYLHVLKSRRLKRTRRAESVHFFTLERRFRPV